MANRSRRVTKTTGRNEKVGKLRSTLDVAVLLAKIAQVIEWLIGST